MAKTMKQIISEQDLAKNCMETLIAAEAEKEGLFERAAEFYERAGYFGLAATNYNRAGKLMLEKAEEMKMKYQTN